MIATQFSRRRKVKGHIGGLGCVRAELEDNAPSDGGEGGGGLQFSFAFPGCQQDEEKKGDGILDPCNDSDHARGDNAHNGDYDRAGGSGDCVKDKGRDVSDATNHVDDHNHKPLQTTPEKPAASVAAAAVATVSEGDESGGASAICDAVELHTMEQLDIDDHDLVTVIHQNEEMEEPLPSQDESSPQFNTHTTSSDGLPQPKSTKTKKRRARRKKNKNKDNKDKPSQDLPSVPSPKPVPVPMPPPPGYERFINTARSALPTPPLTYGLPTSTPWTISAVTPKSRPPPAVVNRKSMESRKNKPKPGDVGGEVIGDGRGAPGFSFDFGITV